MRFDFDERKSARLRANPKRGIGFEKAQKIFERPYYQDQRSELPEQFRAIGWVASKLYTVIYEVREDEEGESITWLRFGKPRVGRHISMKKSASTKKPVSADAIARMADQGKDISSFFTGTGKMIRPVQRVNVDFAAGMLDELDREAQDLHISRQAVIKSLLRQALDQRRLASAAR